MKKMLTLLFLFFIFVSSVYGNYDGEISLQKTSGDVIIETEYDGIIHLDTGRYPIFKNDRIVTQKGKAEIYALNGSQIKINEDSILKLIEFTDKRLNLRLETGSYYIVCQNVYDDSLQLEIPYGKLLCTSNSKFYLSIDRFEKIKISVYEGRIVFNRGFSTTSINKGDTIMIENGNITRLPNIDKNYYTYNETVVSYNTYLPPQLSVFAVELKRHGRWIYVADYGYCWLPLTISREVWSPYQCGRWITRGGRQIWIACEPWGWLPHHYGRWVYLELYGWLWVPPHRSYVRWEPAHVVWFESPRGKTWIPLAPNEVYNGRPIRVENSFIFNNSETRQQYRNLSFYNRHERNRVDNNSNSFSNTYPTINHQNSHQRNDNQTNRNYDSRLLDEQNFRRSNNNDRVIYQRNNDYKPININPRKFPIVEEERSNYQNIQTQIERPHRENNNRKNVHSMKYIGGF